MLDSSTKFHMEVSLLLKILICEKACTELELDSIGVSGACTFIFKGLWIRPVLWHGHLVLWGSAQLFGEGAALNHTNFRVPASSAYLSAPRMHSYLDSHASWKFTPPWPRPEPPSPASHQKWLETPCAWQFGWRIKQMSAESSIKRKSSPDHTSTVED